MVDKWRDTDYDQFKDTETDQWRDTGESTAAPSTAPPTTPPPTEPHTTLPPTTELPTSPPPSLPPTSYPPPTTESPAEAAERIRRLLESGAIRISWIPGPAWTQEVLLDNVNYQIRAIWNDLYEYWTLDFLTESGALIMAGLKLMPNWELIRRYGNEDLPPGALTCFTITGRNTRIDYDDLMDGNAMLIYEPVEEAEYII